MRDHRGALCDLTNLLAAYLGPQLGDNGVRMVCIGLTIFFVVVFFWKLERAKRD